MQQSIQTKVKSNTFATRMSNKIKDRFGLSYNAGLGISIALNFGMGVVWTAAGILGGSSFLFAEAADSFADAFNYALSISVLKEKKKTRLVKKDGNFVYEEYMVQPSNRTRAITTFIKAGITGTFSFLALGFSVLRFALGWAVNPVLGLGLSLLGIGINGACAYLLAPDFAKKRGVKAVSCGHAGHDHSNHEEHFNCNHSHAEDFNAKGVEHVKNANWHHTIGDLAVGAVGAGFSILDIIGLPGADLIGGAVGATIGFQNSLDIFKEGRKLWKLHKEEKAHNKEHGHVYAKEHHYDHATKHNAEGLNESKSHVEHNHHHQCNTHLRSDFKANSSLSTTHHSNHSGSNSKEKAMTVNNQRTQFYMPHG